MSTTLIDSWTKTLINFLEIFISLREAPLRQNFLMQTPSLIIATLAATAAPRFAIAGFCAMGVVMDKRDKKLDIDPQLWRVVDGMLYLDVHKPAQTRRLEDIKGNLYKGEKNWSNSKDKVPNSL